MDELGHRFINRELSWLAFDDRVLQLAEESGIPLLERAKFCAITSSNLDEFFQVRVAALKDQIAAGIEEPTLDGRSATHQLAEIAERAGALVDHQERVYLDQLVPELADAGVAIVSWSDLDAADQKRLGEVYEQRIFPVLTPLAVDPSHPFPYISNLALSIAVMVDDPDIENDQRFARVKVPTVFPRLVEVDRHRYLPVEDLIIAHLHTLFVGMTIVEAASFRVTRNADLTLEEEEADDLLEAVEVELRRRRFNRAVRLEVSEDMSDDMLEVLMRELEVQPSDVYRLRGPVDLGFLWQLHGLDRPDLKDRPWPPITAGRIAVAEEADRPLFSVMRDRAIFVHHPYESFTTSTEAFIGQAADDPRVQSIKMTLYRAGGDSPIIRSLMRAVERGVQVAVLVELKARFDEATNIGWARQLERAGVHVVYGMAGLKTHCKCVLVVRDDGDQLRRYCHLGTGNYNTRTARLYEDLGILTCDLAVGADVTRLFNHLTGYSRGDTYQELLVAPRGLRARLLELIDRERRFGEAGRITIKANSIGDAEMIEALYAAGQAGVQVDLIIRGISCLRAGVPGLSERVRVRSILGRYLEHSRIYRFAHGDVDDEPEFLIGSADLMPRNLDRRVEVLVPIEHPKHRDWLDQVFEFQLSEDIVRWELQPDDTWVRRGPADAFVPHAQERMYRWAVERQAVSKR
ncbi:MAG: polyphosphate kinase 1 [Ilumatobacteraceae bacterium]